MDEDRALAELGLAWADGGYHGFSAEGGTWSRGHQRRGGARPATRPDALDRAIRAHWQAMQ